MKYFSHEGVELGDSYQVPMISVIMPVYNAETFVQSAVDSILNQTYSSFELLLLDDQSTDSSVRILEQFRDARIKIITSQKHLGLTGQLNKGLELARGKYIARMDADDWALPNRFEEQVRFLEGHHHVGICGSYYRTINIHGDKLDEVNTYSSNGILKYRSFLGNPFCHPSIMMRKSLIVSLGGYSGRYAAEDYDLWVKAYHVTDFYVLPKILLHYRVHTGSVSFTERVSQEKESLDLKKMHLNDMMQGSLSDTTLCALAGEFDFAISHLPEVVHAYELFLQRFRNSKDFSRVDNFFIKQEAAVFYFRLLLYAKRGSLLIPFFKNYMSFPFFDKVGITFREQAYLNFYRNQLLNAWLFLLLCVCKTPFSKVNIIIGVQLLRKMIGRFKFWPLINGSPKPSDHS